MPETTDNARWVGFVVGVGPETRFLRFGDIVEVSRWEKDVSDGGSWWHKAPGKLIGQWGECAFDYESPGGQKIRVEWDWWLACYAEKEVIYRLAKYGYEDEAGVEPLGTKIVVKHKARSENTDTGIKLFSEYYRSPPPVAQVVAVGELVDPDDAKVGDWVMVEPNKGSIIKTEDGEMTVLGISAVQVNFGSECPDGVEVKGAAA